MVEKYGKHFNKLGIHLLKATDMTPPEVLRQGTNVTRRLLTPFRELVVIEGVSP